MGGSEAEAQSIAAVVLVNMGHTKDSVAAIM